MTSKFILGFTLIVGCIKSSSGADAPDDFTYPLSCHSSDGKVTDLMLGCIFDGSLNEANDFKSELQFEFPASSLYDMIPFVTSNAELETKDSIVTTDVLMNVVAYTNTYPTIWSHKKDCGHEISRYISVSTATFDNDTYNNVTVSLVFSTTTKLTINFDVFISLKNISLSLGMKKKDLLSYGSPILYKFNSPKANHRKVRVQIW